MASIVPVRKVKIIIIGPSGVGKTCLIHRYVKNRFIEDTKTSIVATNSTINWGSCEVNLWDTAGEEKFAAITSLYCRNASVVLLAYDITKLESFKKLQNVFISYLDFVQTVCLNVVVGCKLDLIDTNKQPREVDEQLGRGLAEVLHKNQLEKVRQHSKQSNLENIAGKSSFFEVSSKTGRNIESLFNYIKQYLLETQDCGVISDSISVKRLLTTSEDDTINDRKTSCSC